MTTLEARKAIYTLIRNLGGLDGYTWMLGGFKTKTAKPNKHRMVLDPVSGLTGVGEPLWIWDALVHIFIPVVPC